MKLKKYLQFIKESLKDDIEEKKLWKLTEEDIKEYMLEITDAGYDIYIEFGFCNKIKQGYYKNGDWLYKEKEIFDKKLKSGEAIPSYWIQIQKGIKKISNDDVTSTFQFACSIISEEGNTEISVQDDEGGLGDPEKIVIKGGLFYTNDWSKSEPELLETEEYIAIFAKGKESFEVKDKDLVEYYNWSDVIVKDNSVYTEISLEDLSNLILSRKSDYKDILVKGEEAMYDNYFGSDYQPDTPSMFQYNLNKENGALLIKAMIKELGGLENFISECNNEYLEGKSEEEVIEYLLKERFYDTLKKLCKDSEVCQEVKQTIGDWNMHAHIDEEYKNVINEFDRIVSKELKFSKEDKEVKKYYTTKDAEGNQVRREYEDIVTFYIIPYNNDWIGEKDEDDLKDKSLYEIFMDWLSEQNLNYDMNPRLSDYGDVDSKSLNKDIKYDLEGYLKN
jgi:hypothetical protein